MVIVKSISSQSGKEITLISGSGESYALSLSDFNSLGFKKNSEDIDYPIEISGEREKIIPLLSEKLSAVKYAAYILSFGDKSTKQLSEKLKSNKFSNKSIILAIDMLSKEGILSDETLCERKIISLANEKLYGKRRIKSELYAKGFTYDLIEQKLMETELDYEGNLKKLFIKSAKGKIPSDYREKKKLFDKLSRYGYNYDEIGQILNEFE